MTAMIINLAERRAALTEPAAPGRDRVMDLLLVLADEMGRDTAKYRTGGAAPPPAPPKPKPTILELIHGIADDLGIDVEAPFRRKPETRPFVVPPKPGNKKPPKPRRGRTP